MRIIACAVIVVLFGMIIGHMIFVLMFVLIMMVMIGRLSLLMQVRLKIGTQCYNLCIGSGKRAHHELLKPGANPDHDFRIRQLTHV